MKSICLVGFMGSGKTTIGKELAKQLHIDFYDTDVEIEAWRKMSIPQIFEKEGEEYFRQYEAEILRKLPTNYAIIATGGGVVERKENRNWIKESLLGVYLKPTFDIISNRLTDDKSRPLWNKQEEEKRELFIRRIPLYEDCVKISIDIKTESTVKETVNTILNSINDLK
ncbi:shikimate kinase [Salirhabdus euzebyi]|uniref:Shikimate kinase n=1 Tax=Salirhabdus euzebyi TaxID=394506 RepID=A0A841Q7E4_9BACI|nr:shikimate kinase [Salirhabdus euzebyi]MBB6454254.1 shikimate kinase [Salirhabdus euzebyi]